MEITKIPAIPRQELYGEKGSYNRKIRVALYVRVSTELDEQESSFENQLSHYETLKKEHAHEWDMEGLLYSDDGISGKFADSRGGFTSLINDCEAGKIDKVITKSVSRFARNTLECVATARKLKEKGIGVYFEKENIDTLAENSEFILTLMASLAEEESRSISRNVKWTVKKKFERGEVILTTSTFLGYDRDENKNLVINEGEALIIKRIYNEFIAGKSTAQIAKGLRDDNIPTAKGGSRWYSASIISILKNEKYKGDALLQKTYQPDFLSKERVKNDGQVEMYYITDHHPAIIERDKWDYVQHELKRRCIKPAPYSGIRDYSSEKRDFSGIIVCGECGAYYQKHRQYHGNSRKFTEIYQCARHLEKAVQCTGKPIRESDFKGLYVRAMNHLIDRSEETMAELEEMKSQFLNRGLKSKYRENEYAINRLQEELLHQMDLKKVKADTAKIESRISEIQHTIRTLQATNEELAYQVHMETYTIEKIDAMEAFIKKGKKLESFDTDQMRKTIYTITVEPAQIFANVKFECGLERKEIILRKVKSVAEEVPGIETNI